ncbi:filamentous hemagglutinin N-terminal domain-containing protein [Nostoc sp. XA010]|uniref:beta strand repeat-containing protein n=1 Tax=Nostoc sp. XA010 TaxID=2780407 RepID=UPI001E5535C3|nr:filamentous hemagglutinin N-terminal domain-containing protein [Nostoc sp. XA010]MCC5660815.1 filamentous hemagglutinin N-terminal domain-containing protein [Nostoc sp. XA010]
MSKISIGWGWFLGIAICGSSIWSTNCAFADIIPDGTLPNNSSIKLEGNNSIIEGGTQAGGNLFHSFREFSVLTNGAALFNNAADIQNIISRVTGGSASTIDGIIRANGTANLFLINPNGIIFGQNASLNIGGSFVGTTANALQFGNRGFFSATDKNIPSPLLTINPSALLFNQINQNAGIQNSSVAFAGKDPAGFDAFGLRVPDGKSLLLVGGNVSMDGGRLNANGGRVELGGLGEPGTVALGVDGDNLSLRFPNNVARASVSLTNQAAIYVEGTGGGNIAVNARNLEILGGSILSGGIGRGLGTPETVAEDITLNATGEIKVAGSGVVNLVGLGSKGNGGNITIDSDSFSLQDDALLTASTYGQGNAGAVAVQARNAVDLASGDILSTVSAGGVGKGGNIDINAATLSLTDGAQLLTLTREASDTQPAGRGDAGNVNVNVTGAVEISGEKNGSVSAIFSTVQTGTIGNGGNITIDSGSFSLRDRAQLEASTRGQGNAGNVTVRAQDAVSLADGYIFSMVEAGGVGKGGNIDINAATLSLIDSAQLQTVTGGASATQPAGQGDAGNVNINVTGIVDIAGEKNGFVSAILSNVETGTVGNAGNITIDSGSFSLRDRAQLEALTSGRGNAGNVTVRARDAVSLADANILSTVEAGGVGKGGNIDINAATLSLIDSAQLQTATRKASATQPAGRGDAGNVNVNVTGAVKISGEKNGFVSAILSNVETGTIGNGGNITINSGSFSLRDRAQVAASTLGQGNAGNVTVSALDVVSLADNSSIFSTVESGGVGKGGNIDINAATLSLIDGAQVLTNTSEASDTQPAGRGDAGNVNVNVTGAIDIAGEKNSFASGIFSRVETGTVGNGGNITIDSGSFSLRDRAQLAASTSGQGNAGNVTVRVKDAVSLAHADILSTVEAGGIGKGGNININAATLSLIDGAQLLTVTREASTTQPAGRGDAGNVNVNVTGSVNIAGEKNGFISGIGSFVETGTVGNGGNITIDSSSFSLKDGAQLSASTSGLGNAGNVTVRVKDAVSLADNAGILSKVEAGGVGKGGNIDINAATLSLIDGAQLQTATSAASDTQPAGRGDAGNVNVNVTGAVEISGEKNGFVSAILSNVETETVGNGGNITIDSGSFSLSDGAQLEASTSGLGNAGNVNVNVSGKVNIAGEKNGLKSGIFSQVNRGTVGNGGNITIDSGSFSLRDDATLLASTLGQGNAGNVTVRALDGVSLADSYIFSTVSSGGVGKGGNIDINAATLSLIDGAQLQTATSGASATQPAGRGDAGNVNVDVTGIVDIAGEKNGIFSAILSRVETGTVGNGGNITIDSGSFSLSDGAQLTADTLGQGNAGNVTVRARDAVFLADNAAILSTVEAGGVGKGGNIDINAATLSLIDGAQLATITREAYNTQPAGQGDAGNVNIKVTGAIDIAGEKNDLVSVISSRVETGTVGNGGNITINSGSFSLRDGAQLSAETFGQGNAGTIKVNAADFFTISGSTSNFNSGLFVNSQSPTGTAGDIIVTSPRVTLDNSGTLNAESASGNGGDINLQTDLLLLRRGAQISTTAGTEKAGGNGGNITINAPSGFIVAVPSENSDITANAYRGSGGRVDIRAIGIYGIQPRSNPTSLSDITASSEFGVNGTVELNTPDIDPNSGLVNLPTIAADTEVAQTCQAGGNLAKSNFTITGRGGLPPNPGETLNTDAVKVDLITLNPNGNNPDRPFLPSKITTPAPEPIIEATGLALNQKGEVVLTANLPTTTPHSAWLKPASCKAS